MRIKGDAQTPRGRNEASPPQVCHLSPSSPAPPGGGTADPSQHARDLKDRMETWASLGKTTKKQKLLLPGRIGGVSPVSILSGSQLPVRNSSLHLG